VSVAFAFQWHHSLLLVLLWDWIAKLISKASSGFVSRIIAQVEAVHHAELLACSAKPYIANKKSFWRPDQYRE
jgi:hypothetical protein